MAFSPTTIATQTTSARDPRELYEIKQKAVKFYNDNGVPKKMEDVLNTMFYDNPSDVFGYLANYFEKFATTPTITKIKAREACDSKGQATIQTEVFCTVKNDLRLSATVVSPSPNSHLPDNTKPEDREVDDTDRQNSVTAAVSFLNTDLNNRLTGLDPAQQQEVDNVVSKLYTELQSAEEERLAKEAETALTEEGSTKDVETASQASGSKGKQPKSANKGKDLKKKGGKSQMSVATPMEPSEKYLPGAGAVSAMSRAVCVAAAHIKQLPVFQHIAGLRFTEVPFEMTVPLPMVTIIQSGRAALGKSNCIKEFMVVPKPGMPLSQSLPLIQKIYSYVGKSLFTKSGTGKQHVPGSLVTMDGMTSGSVSESTDGSQGSVRRTTAFKIVSSSQPSAFNVQMPPKNEQQPTPHLTLSTTGHSPLKMTASCLMATGSHANGHVRSPAMAVTACPSPKGRPPSISRRVPSTPAMLISAQRAYQEAILTKSHSNSSSNTKATTMSSGPIFTTRTSDQRQKPDATPLTTASDVRSKGPQRSSKCADPVDELWPFPLPTVEQSGHVDVLYDDYLRYERESGPGYIDPYNPFYYDGSYDETRSGLQVDVNSWQKYLNYTKMQNEAEDKTNLTTCFPQPSSTSVWCDQVSNNADQIAQPATHQKQSGSVSSREPRRTSSESCFASSFTSAINVLDDITGGALTTPDGYADVNIRAYQQNKIPQASRDVVDLQRQGSALQALDLSSGTHTQTRVSDIVYLGQETTHIGSGDGVKSIEGSPPDKSEDSRPLKKRTERYRQDFLNGKPCVTSGDVPTGTYLEDVVYLTSPEKAAAESALSRISPRQASDCINTGPKGGHTTSPKMVIDVGHDFLKSLKSGTVITDLTPANLTNAIHVGPNSVGEPAANLTHYDSTETTGNTDKSVDAAHCIAPCIVNIKQELADDY